MSRITSTFPERLKQRRIKCGFRTQEALAAAVGIAKQTVNYYESGKRVPDLVILQKLTTTLNCSLDWLIGRTEDVGEQHTVNEWMMNRFTKCT